MARVKSEQRSARVLIVDDQEGIAALYETWLESSHVVTTVYDAQSALDVLEESFDVVVLDRQMPGRPGDELLQVIDGHGLDCRVIVVSAVDPGFDIIEMPFDNYLLKPITRDELLETIDEVLARDRYDKPLRQYVALVSKKITLEARKNTAELDRSEDYAELCRRIETLGNRVDTSDVEFDSVERLFHES